MTEHLVAAAYTLTGGRLTATAAALVSMGSLVLGGLALARPGRSRRPVSALVAGAAGLLTGAFVLAVADGGPGSGSGVVGAYAAVAFGLIGAGLGGLALSRSRRANPTHAGTKPRAPR